MDSDEALERLQVMSADQFGMFTVPQAATVGVDRAALEELEEQWELSSWVEGVYKLPGASNHGEVYERWLSLAPATFARDRVAPGCGVVSHGSAAQRLASSKFGAGFLAVTFPPETPLPDGLNAAIPDRYVHRAPLPPQDWFMCDGVPVTTPARTVKDLLDNHYDDCPIEDETTIGRYLLRMERRGVDLAELAAELDGWARRNDRRNGEFLVRSISAATHPPQS
ncbi:MAG TPA: hypothetical protein VHU91_02415 [Mycobacteriales bacterium]|jgi:hypothetical protein|nr:hypothetical protein [Mycobacteriales bacterium]